MEFGGGASPLELLMKIKDGLQLRNQLQPQEKNKEDGIAQEIDPELVASIMTIIGHSVDLLDADECVYKKILNNLKFHFSNGIEVGSSLVNIDANSIKAAENLTQVKKIVKKDYPSDLDDMLQFKPGEIFGDKVTQILAYLCVKDLDSVIRELINLQSMREHPVFVLLHPQLDECFCFVGKTFEAFANLSLPNEMKMNIFRGKKLDKEEIPKVEMLSAKDKAVLKFLQFHIYRNFRFKVTQRLEMLKELVAQDTTEAEWWVTLTEAARRKRRDIPKHAQGRRPEIEEYEYLDKAMQMDPQNPFIRLSLLDSIVDCLRDARGSFTCAGTVFRSNSNETIVFMKKTCRDVLKQFPRSVKFHSQISDYFARFVTLCFFDVPFAEECLETAYKLNPGYPPTSHRLGIFNRMSKGNLTKSFEWFVKAEQLDKYHFNAFMECVKNWIREPMKYNIPELIHAKLKTEGACSWSDLEIFDLLFYKGVGHFARKEFDDALDAWNIVSIHNPKMFRLCDFDQAGGFYNWDENTISTDKLRLWMHEENSKKVLSPDRKELVTYLYNLMVGIVEPKKINVIPNPLVCKIVILLEA